jgi:hypothetical protein
MATSDGRWLGDRRCIRYAMGEARRCCRRLVLYAQNSGALLCYMQEHKGGAGKGSDGGVPWIVVKDCSTQRGGEGKRRNGSVISGELSG